jgi:tRNA C32,U32 (ribose-2'-O)-methylase TrmJ
MTESEVLANQKAILDGQAAILANQKAILDQQHVVDVLSAVLKNLELVLATLKKQDS